MRCDLCGFEYDTSDLKCHSGCPMSSHCNLVCCPNCGYQAVDEGKSRLPAFLRKLWPARQEAAGTAPRPAPPATTAPTPLTVPLTHIAAGAKVRVRRLGQMPPSRLARLSSFGLVPGKEVTVAQRRPVPVLRIDHTDLALSEEIVGTIWVEPPAHAAGTRAGTGDSRDPGDSGGSAKR